MASIFNNNVFCMFVLRASLLAFTSSNFNYLDARPIKYTIDSKDVFMENMRNLAQVIRTCESEKELCFNFNQIKQQIEGSSHK